jgi:hypothetical protein
MSRPGDVYHPDFDQGHSTYFDISVCNSLQASYIIQAAIHAGVASEAGKLEKDYHHNSSVEAHNCLFHPLVVESLGLWSAHSLQILKQIARRLTFRYNFTFSQSIDLLHQQLSLKLWQYNAKMVLSRLCLDVAD